MNNFRSTLGNVLGGALRPGIRSDRFATLVPEFRGRVDPDQRLARHREWRRNGRVIVAEATAVRVGSALFIRSDTMIRIARRLEALSEARAIEGLADLMRGARVEHEPIA